MKYCIYKIENHPDRGIMEIYGPYDCEDDARADAAELDKEASNFNGDHQLGCHYTTMLEPYRRTIPLIDHRG